MTGTDIHHTIDDNAVNKNRKISLPSNLISCMLGDSQQINMKHNVTDVMSSMRGNKVGVRKGLFNCKLKDDFSEKEMLE